MTKTMKRQSEFTVAKGLEVKGRFVVDTTGVFISAKPISLKGTVTFGQLNARLPLCVSFISQLTGEKLGELKEQDGVLTFEGKADESAKVFFAELAKNNFNPKQ